MLVTAIEPRKKCLSALFLDGEFVKNIDTETLAVKGWKIGREVSDEELYELIQASDGRRANEKALYLLEHRSHSKKELAEKIRRTASPEAAQMAADRMEALGLIDDEAYARDFAAMLLNRKGYSASRTRYELQQKGINKELSAQIVAELDPGPEEKLKELLERKYSRDLEDEKKRRRAVNALQRLGYSFDEIRRAIRDLGTSLEEE